MNMIIPFKDKKPQLGENVFIADGARIIGDVTLNEGCNVWFNAVIRGDVGPIVIGASTNIQDNCVIHITTGGPYTTIGHHVTIGHGAIIHACTIEDFCLIGMGSVILDGAIIEKGALVAAQSLVPPNKILKGGFLWQGQPAQAVRPLRPEEHKLILETAPNYQKLAQTYLAS